MEVRSDEFRPLFSGPTAAERPLFGTTNTRDRVVNLVVGLGSALLFTVTLLSAFLAQTPPRGVNIYLVFCISLILLSHVLLIYCDLKSSKR
ncbi:hypothetical protein JTE90_011376 [Oedothorax gibbosus]|uniref:Transmembrane protein 243 n=1 Tax=Oedothorax gibbosus TaxID=931172 RepID=A0AAV6VNB9_9ARAC|nr:hypothetical protein JTE90_011376 [Oedothorax gibbosus]